MKIELLDIKKHFGPVRANDGITFTVEPGLYVSADAENAPQSLRGIGVRIEDDVVSFL